MNAKTWNDLKEKILAVHGPDIDWLEVRHQVDVLQTNPFCQLSAVEAFNRLYESNPLPYRKNNPDGSPTIKVMLEIAATFIVLSVIVLAAYASILLVICLVTALILMGVDAVVKFFHR